MFSFGLGIVAHYLASPQHTEIIILHCKEINVRVIVTLVKRCKNFINRSAVLGSLVPIFFLFINGCDAKTSLHLYTVLGSFTSGLELEAIDRHNYLQKLAKQRTVTDIPSELQNEARTNAGGGGDVKIVVEEERRKAQY